MRLPFSYTSLTRNFKSKFDIAVSEFKIVEKNTEPEHHAGRILSLLNQLVAINSINATLSGGPGEKHIADFIHNYLRRLGFEVQLQAVSGERANVAALVRGKWPGPSVLLNGHIDTVGVEGMVSPFSLRQEGDRLYGRGGLRHEGQRGGHACFGRTLGSAASGTGCVAYLFLR